MGNKKNIMKKKKALISVYEKTNLVKILRNFRKHNIELISSGGTYKEIIKLGYKCEEISKFTGMPEILDGRVKTLHPKIHAGILSERNKESHKRILKKFNFEEIDFVIVNFYPFEKVLNSSHNHEKIIKNIDIGGPTMVRAASKNYKYVTVVTNPLNYEDLTNELDKNNGSTSLSFREKMSEIAFTETGYYDSLIVNYFNRISKNKFPKKKLIYGNLIENLRYGENPHQSGAVYSRDFDFNISLLNGKKLSYNNYNDIIAALLVSKFFPKNTGTVIVKHANPCGASILENKINSLKMALACDPISAYGGIVSCNFKIDKKLAVELNKIFIEAVICKGIEDNALKILSKKKNLRIIDSNKIKLNSLENITSNFNSILIQDPDIKIFKKNDFKIVSKKRPSSNTLKNLIFAFNICRHVKSNAIVLAQDFSTVGIGSGQPSRLDSCKISIDKMRKFQKINHNNEIVAASDAFFPFVDGVEKLVQSGVTAIVQPYGSIRDKEVIRFANQTGIVLLFSKTRHFRH